ncbi:Hint domain-containing protein [Jiella marina]|uniref:Hint domain-containing protein n=1 Tax=Jiella sp. LLJ827 TaxID=2917712 RepID=UPI00210098F7|nr:Hint domain-containing protein [Jiella sp. LLJ827]MCQ0989768.1 Hint domain-containing protein [Jiella sp. LLJ827]
MPTRSMYVNQVTQVSLGTYSVLSGGFADTFSDYDEGVPGDDNLFILGDVSDDLFNPGSSPGTGLTYVGALNNGDGFILTAGAGNYFIAQYNMNYGVGDTADITSSSFAIQCFTPATQITTAQGPVFIEDLSVGDIALTAFGTKRSIVWIGKRTIECGGQNWHHAPVNVRAGAFGAGVPERDVMLSPGHPVMVRQGGREVLVPIMNLINGTTIERTHMNTVTYWHVELDQHDVLLADGLPAESFFDMGTRGWFENDLDDVLANPDLIPAGQHGRCLEVETEGPLVEAERKRLADLFYADLSAQCAWPSASVHAAI